MIVAKVHCKCGKWVRIRTMPSPENPRYEYGWVNHTQSTDGKSGCGRKLEIERRGGTGARIIGRCDGEQVKVDVEYQN